MTAALQGLAAKDVGQAAVGLASPYLNAEIKKYTEGDTQANLIAHALLGAVEAAATGAGSEAAADFIVQTLYEGKSTKELSESEKQTVTFLSQLAGGLASGIIGDSTQSAAVGADIGKRAVENNHFGDDIHPSEDRKQTIEMMAKAMFQGDLKKAEQYYEQHKKEVNNLQLQEYFILTLAKFLPQITTGSTAIAGSFGGGSELLGQLSENNWGISKLDGRKIAVQTGVGIATKNMGVFNTASINSGVEFVYALNDEHSSVDPSTKAGISWITTFAGGIIGKGVELPLDKRLNPNWRNYVERTGHLPYGMSEPLKPSYIPYVVGNSLDNSSSKFLEGYLKPVEVNKDEKK
ncbi:VENN motif pre-toxin domain-containing protein [Bibersteinia trehalosi]|uniref:VENN motif pre-toxin domain-containing protein n=1 Tax=Bibersteinia trehalosi TaxID=47735 RepID=UPI001E638EA2|nr:VENN motif pre-toxin domain-containing protein [Bibersteinia trehalosi]